MNDLVAFIADICAILLFIAAAFSVAVKFYKRYGVLWKWQIIVAFLINLGIVMSLAIFLHELWVTLTVSVGMGLVIFLASEATGRVYQDLIDKQRSIYNEQRALYNDAVSVAIDSTDTAEEALQVLQVMYSKFK